MNPIVWMLSFSLIVAGQFDQNESLEDDRCGPVARKKCTGNFSGYCCSKWGYCGISEEYCGRDNCDTNFGPCGLGKHCGPKHFNKNCTLDWDGGCCDIHGNCGRDVHYCKTFCDPKYGPCEVLGEAHECGPRWDKNCTIAYAGACCNRKYGVCGTTAAYCHGRNCHPKYGRCS